MASQHKWSLSPRKQSRVNARHNPLRRRLLVTRGAINLPRQEKTRRRLSLHCRKQLIRRHIIILDGIAHAHHLHALQRRNTAQHRQLHIFWQARIHPLHIHLARAPPLRLQENLVRALIGKTHDLIFNRGAIARPNSLDNARVKRRAMEVIANDLVSLLRRAHQVTRQLRPPAIQILVSHRVDRIWPAPRKLHILARLRILRKVMRYTTAGLRLSLAEINRSCIDTGRSPRLKASHSQPQSSQRVRDTQRRTLARLVERVLVLELALRGRRDEVEGVDLPVRVLDRRADLGAAVLEHEHVGDLRPRSELRASLRPQVDDLAHPVRTERPERRLVLRRVEDDLAAAVGHRRPAVREPPHVVRARRLEPTGAERAAGGGKVGPVLARPDDWSVSAAIR